jgi:hypothetical protein
MKNMAGKLRLYLLLTLVAVGCTSKEEKQRTAFIADSARRADSTIALLKPRLDMYSSATRLIRAELKAPSSARFAQIQLMNTDSSAIQFADSSDATVTGKYEAQNNFGVFLADKFLVHLQKSSGKWTALNPRYDVNPNYYGAIGATYRNLSGGAPPPMSSQDFAK